MRTRPAVVPLLLTFLATACGGSGPTGNNNQNGAANFSAKVDGAQWTSLLLTTSANGAASGTFTLTGSNSLTASPTSMSLTLYHIGAPGSYPLGVTSTVRGGTAVITQGSNAWSTPLSGAAGTVDITSVSATRLAGTFSFTAEPFFGSGTGNKAVTSGTFDLPVKSTVSVAVPDQDGSKVTGTLGGAAWNAATVVMVAQPSTGTFTFGISNSTHNINVLVSGYTGVGTYTMGTGVARYISVTTQVGGTKTWGGGNSLTSGTLVVTSVTATRIKGTFNVTMQPGIAQPGTGTLAFNGTFDLGLAQ